MKKHKLFEKAVSLLLTLALIFSSVGMVFAGMSNFKESKQYPGFGDVGRSAWYYQDVSTSNQLGLFNGYPDGKFKPSGNITLAEVIKVASLVRATYEGERIPANFFGGWWYDSYVVYAMEKGIIKNTDFGSFDGLAKRNEMAYIFSKVLPSSEYEKLNDISSIPDVLPERKYSSSAIDLYSAGILRGDDEYGTFRPEDNITRAEVAAIVNRVVLKNNRLQFTLRPKPINVVVGYTAADEPTRKLIVSKMNRVNDETRWLSRELTDVERSILAKIEADPKNCYPEFDSIGYFNDVKGGADYYAGYANFITIVLMCQGDIRNYDDGVL